MKRMYPLDSVNKVNLVSYRAHSRLQITDWTFKTSKIRIATGCENLPGNRLARPQHRIVGDVDGDDRRVLHQLLHGPAPTLDGVHLVVLFPGPSFLKPEPTQNTCFVCH